jgi:hypothetical protein
MDTVILLGSKNATEPSFSEVDRKAMKGSQRAYFSRTPSGDVRLLDPRTKRKTRNLYGASGISVCPDLQPCLPAYGP